MPTFVYSIETRLDSIVCKASWMYCLHETDVMTMTVFSEINNPAEFLGNVWADCTPLWLIVVGLQFYIVT